MSEQDSGTMSSLDRALEALCVSDSNLSVEMDVKKWGDSVSKLCSSNDRFGLQQLLCSVDLLTIKHTLIDRGIRTAIRNGHAQLVDQVLDVLKKREIPIDYARDLLLAAIGEAMGCGSEVLLIQLLEKSVSYGLEANLILTKLEYAMQQCVTNGDFGNMKRVLDLLGSADADKIQKARILQSRICQAVVLNQLDLLNFLMEKFQDVKVTRNVKDIHYYQLSDAIFDAATASHFEALRILVDFVTDNALCYEKLKYGFMKAMECAVTVADVEMFKHLLMAASKLKAKWYIREWDEDPMWNILKQAAKSGNQELIELFLEYCILLGDVGSNIVLLSFVCAQVASQSQQVSAAEFLDQKIIEMIKSYPLCVEWKTAPNHSPFEMAAETGRIEVLKYLMNRSQADDEASRSKRTLKLKRCMEYAAEFGHLDVLEYILTMAVESGIQLLDMLKESDRDGLLTGLVRSAKAGQASTAYYLIDLCKASGADFNDYSSSLNLAAQVSIEYGQYDIYRYIRDTLESVSDSSSMQLMKVNSWHCQSGIKNSCLRGDFDTAYSIIQVALKSETIVIKALSSICEEISWIVERCGRPAVDIFLDRGVFDARSQQLGVFLANAIKGAAAKNDVNFVKYLIERATGFDVSIKLMMSKFGKMNISAIEASASHETPVVLDLLIEHFLSQQLDQSQLSCLVESGIAIAVKNNRVLALDRLLNLAAVIEMSDEKLIEVITGCMSSNWSNLSCEAFMRLFDRLMLIEPSPDESLSEIYLDWIEIAAIHHNIEFLNNVLSQLVKLEIDPDFVLAKMQASIHHAAYYGDMIFLQYYLDRISADGSVSLDQLVKAMEVVFQNSSKSNSWKFTMDYLLDRAILIGADTKQIALKVLESDRHNHLSQSRLCEAINIFDVRGVDRESMRNVAIERFAELLRRCDFDQVEAWFELIAYWSESIDELKQVILYQTEQLSRDGRGIRHLLGKAETYIYVVTRFLEMGVSIAELESVVANVFVVFLGDWVLVYMLVPFMDILIRYNIRKELLGNLLALLMTNVKKVEYIEPVMSAFLMAIDAGMKLEDVGERFGVWFADAIEVTSEKRYIEFLDQLISYGATSVELKDAVEAGIVKASGANDVEYLKYWLSVASKLRIAADILKSAFIEAVKSFVRRKNRDAVAILVAEYLQLGGSMRDLDFYIPAIPLLLSWKQ